MSEELQVHFGANQSNYFTLFVIETRSSLDSISVVAEVKTRGFYGSMDWHIQPRELAEFETQLTTVYQTLSGKATFTTIVGEWLGFDITIDKFGMVRLTGFLSESAYSRNRLEFEITDLDQSYLPTIWDKFTRFWLNIIVHNDN